VLAAIGPRSDRFGTLGLARGIEPGEGAAAAHGSNTGSAALGRETKRLQTAGIENSGGIVLACICVVSGMGLDGVGCACPWPADRSGFCRVPGRRGEGLNSPCAYRVNATMKCREARPRNRVGAAAGLALGRKKNARPSDRLHLKGAAGRRLRRSGRFRESNRSPGLRPKANRLRQPAGPGSVVLGKSRQFRLFQLLP
jgi:hypothetical protein